MPGTTEKIQPEQAIEVVENGALLVSAYDGEKFERTKIGDAISASEFAARADELSRDRELVFY